MALDWSGMLGGYRRPYDPRPAIARLRNDPTDASAWAELWSALHHQGDVGEASYAAVPLLVDACAAGPRDWNLFGLIATIEVERHRRANPPLPDALARDYAEALTRARGLALADLADTRDPLVVQTALAIVALADGALELGALFATLDTSEIGEVLDRYLAWSEQYDVGTR